MLHCIVRLLLVVALVSSGATAPFLHVHAHGADHGGWHAEQADEHCAHHHAEGAHWHLGGSAAARAGGTFTTGAASHRHAAVALSSAAVEAASAGLDVAGALVDAPESGVPVGPGGLRPPVAADAGPDPPPLILLATRAPPVRS